MRSTPLLNDPARAWSAFEVTPGDPWDLPRVAHLHRRAGFSAPWPVLKRDQAEGLSASVDRLLEGEAKSGDGLPASEHEALMDVMAGRVAASGNLARLQGAWLYRMIFTPYPLRERMTLFWHNHFATSNAKVNNTGLMQRQCDNLRRDALGKFPPMLRDMAKDAAMLQWLDCTANRKAHPNENYAREVMELFTLGRGHYSEKDIQEAARAFTGTFVQNDQYKAVPSQHDNGDKTVLGKTGRFGGDDVAAILLEQPACAEFLARKLYRHFLSEVDTPSPDLIAPLAAALRKSDYDIKATVGLILKSRLFHDPAMRRKRVKSPVEFAIGTARALEILKPTLSADALAEATGRMGQSLFAPPSVAGWEGGPAWINTTTTLARSNFCLGVLGKDGGLGGRFTPKKGDAAYYVDLLVQDGFDATVKGKIRGDDAVTLVLTSPEYQLS
jgi:uncharacterized protein (DUF1800 family)